MATTALGALRDLPALDVIRWQVPRAILAVRLVPEQVQRPMTRGMDGMAEPICQGYHRVGSAWQLRVRCCNTRPEPAYLDNLFGERDMGCFPVLELCKLYKAPRRGRILVKAIDEKLKAWLVWSPRIKSLSEEWYQHSG